MTTDSATPLLGTGGILFLLGYLASLIVVGLLGRFSRRENSMADFYLSGRNMGPFVLVMTLYATQYSGNTLLGFAGKAYRSGYQFLVSVTFMIAVIGAYLIYAPKLYRRSRKRHYITVGDYLQDRFGSPVLTVLATILCIIALGNYILTNLKAIGLVLQTMIGEKVLFTLGNWEVNTFTAGIILTSLIMVLYETLGGMRSVAWTDVIQGFILLAGCCCIFGLIHIEYGGLAGVAEKLIETDLWRPPNAEQKRVWLSTLVLIFFGISLYPHAIQRIYAARDERTLRRSMQIMVFMPLLTTFFMIVVGVVGAAQIPGLNNEESDKITLLLIADLTQKVPGTYAILVLFLAAVIAAIMSTVDSALLAASSLITKDLYYRIRPNASQAHLTRVGKLFSWLLIALAVYLAITLGKTLWRLIEIKLEILCQLAPAIFLGLHFGSLRTRPVLWGLILGTLVTVTLMFGEQLLQQETITYLRTLTDGLRENIAEKFGFSSAEVVTIPAKPGGIHAGVWGLLVNFLTVGAGSLFGRQQLEAGGVTR